MSMAASGPARIVNVSSDAHYQAKGIDFTALRRRARTVTGVHAYAVSKLCNVLFSRELARRLDGRGVSTYALHPGVVRSDMWRQVPWPVRPLLTARMLTTEQGAQTSLYCATSPQVSGGNVLFTLLGFMGLYALLSVLFLTLVSRHLQRGPQAPEA